jgi:hypothetical protein
VHHLHRLARCLRHETGYTLRERSPHPKQPKKSTTRPKQHTNRPISRSTRPDKSETQGLESVRPILRPAPTYTAPGRQNKHPRNARLADSRIQVAERYICYDQTTGLIRKLGSGILATLMALRLPHEALEAVDPVHSRAPEPPHIHPELAVGYGSSGICMRAVP